MADSAIPYSDVEVEALSQFFDEAVAAKLFTSAKCALIGAKSKQTRIVTVLVKPGCEGRPRNIDLLPRRYLDAHEDDDRRVGLDKTLRWNAWCVRRYPGTCPTQPPFIWTIYTADTLDGRRKFPENDLYKRLTNTMSPRLHSGNVLIAKADISGVVCDVLERDLFFVEVLVASFFEGGACQLDFPGADNVLIVPGHILLILAQTLSWIDLLRARHFPTTEALFVVGSEIRRRVFGRLDRFIPHELAPDFFQELKSARGFITGGVVREVFLMNHDNAPPPLRPIPHTVDEDTTAEDDPAGLTSTLIIVVAKCNISPLQDFIKGLGYSSIPINEDSRLVDTRKGKDVVATIEHYNKEGGSGQEYDIILLVSENEALSVLMAGGDTADMVAISHDTIVSYYPRLTFANEGLLVNSGVRADDAATMSITLDEEDVEIHLSNYHWTKPCGPYCPELWRCNYDDEGALKVHWDGLKRNKADPKSRKGKEKNDNPNLGVATPDEESSESKGQETKDKPKVNITPSDRIDSADSTGETETSSELGSAEGTGATESKVANEEGDVHDGEVKGWGVDDSVDVWGNGWGKIAYWNHWNTGRDFTYSEILQWRITNRCKNTQCPNSALHDLRSQYVKM
ncbi:hypothetical protein NMY22_g8245 [Coprinellus aureogranulatus]|nr:hypothetical protein NMY22_g8245 [Coprinellus aureogranulatus]